MDGPGERGGLVLLLLFVFDSKTLISSRRFLVEEEMVLEESGFAKGTS